MNKPVRDASVSVTLPSTAFQTPARQVEADLEAQVGEVDAFEFLHALKGEYERLAAAQAC